MSVVHVRKVLLGAALAAAVAPAAAWAQEPPPPVGGGVGVGGSVASYLELILTKPASSLATFARPRTYSTSFKATITATDRPTLLTLADGDATSGSRLGHLASGSKRLPLPLEATVGRSAFQGLDASIDPLLTRFDDVVTRKTATIRLRQQVRAKAPGTYHKIILVTLSSQTP
jgi:hypothetical protein